MDHPSDPILDGAAVAAEIRAELAGAVTAFRDRRGRSPSLHIVLVGENPASHIYVRNKEKAGHDAGLAVLVHRLPPETPGAEILALVDRLNRDEACDGILVQSPLPPALGRHFEQRVFDAIDPAKDVDGFHPTNAGLLCQGRPRLAPCTPSGVMELLARKQIPVAGRHAVVIGRSDIVGKPMALLLLAQDATVTICHSKTRDLVETARRADILVAAIGRPAFVTTDFVRPGAVVIDVGINSVTSRDEIVRIFGVDSAKTAQFDRTGRVIVGDVHPHVARVASALTPVPGGVGPLTIALLLKNTLTAAEQRR